MQAIDKETEQVIKGIQAAVRAAKLRRWSQEEFRRRHSQPNLEMLERGAGIER